MALALALTAGVVLVLMWSLLRTRMTDSPNLTQANQQVYRQQLKDLEQEYAQGVLSPTDYESARHELLGRLLEDTAQVDRPSPASAPRALVSAMVLAVFLPVAAMSTYLWLGHAEGLNPSMAAADDKDNRPDLEAMAAGLAKNWRLTAAMPSAGSCWVGPTGLWTNMTRPCRPIKRR